MRESSLFRTGNGVITIRCTRSRGPRGFFCLQVDRRGPVIVDVIPLNHSKRTMTPVAKLRILHGRASKLYMRRRINAAVPLANDIIRIHSVADMPRFFRKRGRGLYCAYSIFGMRAVSNGELDVAGQWLLKAGKTYPSPARSTFGPNMILPNELLKRGEDRIVIRFLNDCRLTWDLGLERIDLWTCRIESGEHPDFYTNLDYAP